MTVSDAHEEKWAPVPGAKHVLACSAGGRIRQLPRIVNGRSYPEKDLDPAKTGTSPYWQVQYTDDQGRRRKRPVHVLVLEAHRGLCPPGMEGCHDDDDPDNNNLWNLHWKRPWDNKVDRQLNSPAKPRPAKECVRCGASFEGNGRRCHPCVVAIGQDAAAMLRGGVPLERAAAQLEYPSVTGLHTLAVKYGGYGQSRSRRVRKRLGRWLAGGDSQ